MCMWFMIEVFSWEELCVLSTWFLMSSTFAWQSHYKTSVDRLKMSSLHACHPCRIWKWDRARFWGQEPLHIQNSRATVFTSTSQRHLCDLSENEISRKLSVVIKHWGGLTHPDCAITFTTWPGCPFIQTRCLSFPPFESGWSRDLLWPIVNGDVMLYQFWGSNSCAHSLSFLEPNSTDIKQD